MQIGKFTKKKTHPLKITTQYLLSLPCMEDKDPLNRLDILDIKLIY